MRLKSLFSLFDHYPEQSADLLSSISIWAFMSPLYLHSSITFLFGLLFYLFSFHKWISVSFSPDNLLFPVYTYLDFLQPKYHKQLGRYTGRQRYYLFLSCLPLNLRDLKESVKVGRTTYQDQRKHVLFAIKTTKGQKISKGNFV